MTNVCFVRELLLYTLYSVVGCWLVGWLVVWLVGWLVVGCLVVWLLVGCWLVVDRFVKIRVSAVSSDQVSILPPTNSCSSEQVRKSFLLVAI